MGQEILVYNLNGTLKWIIWLCVFFSIRHLHFKFPTWKKIFQKIYIHVTIWTMNFSGSIISRQTHKKKTNVIPRYITTLTIKSKSFLSRKKKVFFSAIIYCIRMKWIWISKISRCNGKINDYMAEYGSRKIWL